MKKNLVEFYRFLKIYVFKLFVFNTEYKEIKIWRRANNGLEFLVHSKELAELIN